jgi:hypothetical protein
MTGVHLHARYLTVPARAGVAELAVDVEAFEVRPDPPSCEGNN